MTNHSKSSDSFESAAERRFQIFVIPTILIGSLAFLGITNWDTVVNWTKEHIG